MLKAREADEVFPDLLELCDAHERINTPAPQFIAARTWRNEDALVMVSRNFEIDREALAAALEAPSWGEEPS